MHILYHHRTRGQAVEGVHIKSIARALEDLDHQVDILSFPGAEVDHRANPSVLADPQKLDKSVQSIEGKESEAQIAQTPSKLSFKMRVIKWITKHAPEWLFELMELAYNLLALVRLRKSFKQQNYQLVYERYSMFMFAATWLCRKRQVPIVIEINDSCLL
jgi:hypothetical protein